MLSLKPYKLHLINKIKMNKTYNKKVILLLLFMVSLFVQLYPQKTYDIKDFSRLYTGKVYIEDTDNEDAIAKVRIFDKASGKLLIETEVEMDISTNIEKNGEIDSNTLEIPYGTQSLVICDDFNCDGTDDIAIKIGNFSCYGGPAFDVYVSKNGTLIKDNILSELAQNYCGMFSFDCENKEINVMTKDGCCYHLYRTYNIINGIPQLNKEVEENVYGFFPKITTTEMKDGKEYIYEKPFWAILNEKDNVFQFTLQNSGKTVVLFLYNQYLIYTLLNKEGNIEFMYPSDADQEVKEFRLTQNGYKKELTFSNLDTKYTICESNRSVGIEVYTKKKLYEMKGNWESKTGNLSALEDLSVSNLSIIKSE